MYINSFYQWSNKNVIGHDSILLVIINSNYYLITKPTFKWGENMTQVLNFDVQWIPSEWYCIQSYFCMYNFFHKSTAKMISLLTKFGNNESNNIRNLLVSSKPLVYIHIEWVTVFLRPSNTFFIYIYRKRLDENSKLCTQNIKQRISSESKLNGKTLVDQSMSTHICIHIQILLT